MNIGPFTKRKEIRLPTWKGWLLILIAITAASVFLVTATPIFLAPHRPIGADVLVVEGWVDEYSLEAAIDLEKKNHYKLVLVSGGPVEKGLITTSYGTYANLGASRLREMGFPGTNLVKVPSPEVLKDRTYHSALAVKRFLLANTTYRSLEIVSGGVHARRSCLLYEIACRPEIKVGVYAIPDPDFDPKKWYRSSAGVRNVLSEAIAYVYARIFFRPSAYEAPKQITPLPTGN